MKRLFIVIAILVLTLVAAIALGVDRSQTAMAQGPQPPDVDNSGGSGGTTTTPQWYDNLPPGESLVDSEIQVSPYRRMSYQGKLEIDGSPCSGTINITFRLFNAASLGTKVWEETQSVTCDNGLFSVMLGAVTPLPYSFQSQLWLSVQLEGSPGELLPRQMLGAVGYAMNLLPGATLVDENPAGSYSYSLWVHSYEHNGIYASSDITDGIGLHGVASGLWEGGGSYPAGVWGVANDGVGVLGQGKYMGVRGRGNYGVYGEASGNEKVGVLGDGGSYTATLGVYGFSAGENGIGVYGYASGPNGIGMMAATDSTNYAAAVYNNNGNTASGLWVTGNTDLDGNLTVSGLIYGTLAPMAMNAGTEPLERGDVVAVVGMDAPVIGQIPVLRVQKATPETASAIVGVVDAMYEACSKPANELLPGEPCGGYRSDVTTIQPGQYLGVVTLGVFQWLKVDASTPIKTGDLLSLSPTAGVAAKAVEITIDGYSFYAPGTIIGKALQDLDSGTGTIAVFVSLK